MPITDKLAKATPEFSTKLSAPVDETDTVLPLSSVAGLPTDTPVFMTLDATDADGKPSDKKEVVKGIVSGSELVNCVRGVEGLAQAHEANAPATDWFTAIHWNSLIEHLLAEHNPDGSHGDVDANSLDVTSNATVGGSMSVTGVISERGLSLQTLHDKMLGGKSYVEEGTAVLSAAGGLNWAVSEGYVWIGGRRRHLAAQTGTAVASKDTYFDVHDDNNDGEATLVVSGGNVVANYAQAPALSSTAVRIGMGRTNGATFAAHQKAPYELYAAASGTSAVGFDSLGNPIYPTTPSSKLKSLLYVTSGATNGVSAALVTHNMFARQSLLGFLAREGRQYKITVKYFAAPDAADAEYIHWLRVSSSYGVAVTDGSMTNLGRMQDTLRSNGRDYYVEGELFWQAPSTGSFYLASGIQVPSANWTWRCDTPTGGTYGPAVVMIEELER